MNPFDTAGPTGWETPDVDAGKPYRHRSGYGTGGGWMDHRGPYCHWGHPHGHAGCAANPADARPTRRVTITEDQV
jgi:hypothetical protein